MSSKSDKIFIGGVSEGRFHEAENTHLILFLTARDVKAITDHAKNNGAGVFENDKGERVVKLAIKTGKKSGKPYCEIDQFQPDANAAPEPEEPRRAEATGVKKPGDEGYIPGLDDAPETEDDLPF